MKLERRDACESPLRGPDLSRKLRQGRKVVSGKSASRRKPISGELHAVAGVPGEPDHHVIKHAFVDAINCVCHVIPYVYEAACQ